MLVIVLHLNIIYIAGLMLAAFLVGYLLRSAQLRKHRRKIQELEQEMLSNHAEILELEKEKAILMRKREAAERNRAQ